MPSRTTQPSSSILDSIEPIESFHLLNPWSNLHRWRNGLILPQYPASPVSSEAEYPHSEPAAAGVPILSISISPKTLLDLAKCEPILYQQDVVRAGGLFDLVTIKFGGEETILTLVLDVHMPAVRQALQQWEQAGVIPCFFRTVEGSLLVHLPSLQTQIPRFIAKADKTEVPSLSQRMSLVAKCLKDGQLEMAIPPESIPIAVCVPEDMFNVMNYLGGFYPSSLTYAARK